jgi:hypothetical protein
MTVNTSAREKATGNISSTPLKYRSQVIVKYHPPPTTPTSPHTDKAHDNFINLQLTDKKLRSLCILAGYNTQIWRQPSQLIFLWLSSELARRIG